MLNYRQYDCVLVLVTAQIRSQWQSGLRRRCTAAHLLGLRVPIPLGAWISLVTVVCCQVEVSETGRSFVQRSPADCGVSLRVI